MSEAWTYHFNRGMLRVPLHFSSNVLPCSTLPVYLSSFVRLFHASMRVSKKAKQRDKFAIKLEAERPSKKRTNATPISTLVISKSISWLLRHGAVSEGLPMRPDGYVPVEDLLRHPKLCGLDARMVEKIVEKDEKNRFDLSFEPRASGPASTSTSTLRASSPPNIWWIRANQGHTLSGVELNLQPITSASQVKMAVHGTNVEAWKHISREGLSRMGRQHVHLAQGVVGPTVVSGMRSSSRVLIYIDLQKALEAGLEFYLSTNGVVLTPGNERGIVEPRFFEKVEMVGGGLLPTPKRED